MTEDDLHQKGLVLLGCGKMGSALLRGCLRQGFPASSVWIVDPQPQAWLSDVSGLHVNAPLPEAPALVLVAVKPQMMAHALPGLSDLAGGTTVFLTIAAGVTLDRYGDILGADTPVIRAMPNTPAAVGHGITALIGNAATTPAMLDQAEALMSAVGTTVRLDEEAQMDAVTAISGSGPAYVFHLIEAMAAAGEALGLAPDLALTLARTTVAGAGDLAEHADEDPAQLRRNVTSPNGTTQAGLEVLMAEPGGLRDLVDRTAAAAAARSRALS